jgi:hypothetical protein
LASLGGIKDSDAEALSGSVPLLPAMPRAYESISGASWGIFCARSLDYKYPVTSPLHDLDRNVPTFRSRLNYFLNVLIVLHFSSLESLFPAFINLVLLFLSS